MMFTVTLCLIPTFLVLYGIRKWQERKWGICMNSVRLDGKVAIVTGANSGIGFEIAKELAHRGAKVILACRNVPSAEDAITKIQKELHERADLIAVKLDLASLQSVEEFAQVILEKYKEIHILVNNAGVAYPKKQLELTHDGYEAHFGVNHLGHFHLTNLLLDIIKSSAPGRVVIVSSSLHQQGAIKFDQIDNPKAIDFSNKPNLYADSKLANVYFCKELIKRLQGKRVSVYAVCPGWVYSGLFRHSLKWYHYILVAPVAFLFMRSPRQGSQTPIFCITQPELENQIGFLYRDCKEFKSKIDFRDEIGEKLWTKSSKLVKMNKK